MGGLLAPFGLKAITDNTVILVCNQVHDPSEIAEGARHAWSSFFAFAEASASVLRRSTRVTLIRGRDRPHRPHRPRPRLNPIGLRLRGTAPPDGYESLLRSALPFFRGRCGVQFCVRIVRSVRGHTKVQSGQRLRGPIPADGCPIMRTVGRTVTLGPSAVPVPGTCGRTERRGLVHRGGQQHRVRERADFQGDFGKTVTRDGRLWIRTTWRDGPHNGRVVRIHRR